MILKIKCSFDISKVVEIFKDGQKNMVQNLVFYDCKKKDLNILILEQMVFRSLVDNEPEEKGYEI